MMEKLKTDEIYDIYISYRKEGGYVTAKQMYDLLVQDGYKVFFDLHKKDEKNDEETTYRLINQCTDFLIILDKGCFMHADESNSLFRKELAHALNADKNVIPIMLGGFEGLPEHLPEDIARIKFKNGPQYNHYYFDAFYRVLKETFLHTARPSAKKKSRGVYDSEGVKVRRRYGNYLFMICALEIIMSIVGAYNITHYFQNVFAYGTIMLWIWGIMAWLALYCLSLYIHDKILNYLVLSLYQHKCYQVAYNLLVAAERESFFIFKTPLYLRGLMHYYGHGVEKNYVKSLECFEQNAKNKVGMEMYVSMSHYFLGLQYYYGQGTSPDRLKARMHLRIAAEHGLECAVKAINQLY